MKTKNSVLNSFLVMLVSFSLLITSSVAWFVSNKKTASGDLGLGLEKDDTKATYVAYMYDLEKGYGTNKTADGKDLSISNLVLNRYDTIFKTKNICTPAFAQIRIKGSESMQVEQGTVHITIYRDTEVDISDNDTITSNIVRFSAFLDQSALSNPDKLEDSGKPGSGIDDPVKLYDYINSEQRFAALEDFEENTSWSKSFVTIEQNGDGTHTHTVADSITISVPYTSDDWIIHENGTRTLVVYLYITYDAELIKCYRDNHTGGDLSLNNPSVEFVNDFELIKISYS